MKKMNKILTTVLVIALAALTLAGCAKKDASPVTTDGSTPPISSILRWIRL